MATPYHMNFSHGFHEIAPSLVIITINLILNLSYQWPSVYKKRRHITFSLYGHAKHNNPCLGGHEINKFVTPFLGLHYFVLNLSDLYPSVYKKRRRKNDFCGHTLTQERLGGHETLVDPSLIIIILYLVCLNHARLEKKILKGIMHFYSMTYMAMP